ncbi:heme exporter protein CcmD [Caulobacter zeae]|uniref:Heme exporter protein D n=1 Tax=Caulobacter zeae TaxID=2055137 RepID=A0A2N5CXW9_9CAUL|nr:heme exporter protein CcmD [Caulobacter zeae]PLR18642.1 heme exporter protein CcmD [Caulobacter zeae]
MQFDFDAGKYAVYVWPAFALTAAVFAWMIADSLSVARRWRAEAERRQAEAKQARQ